MSSSGGLRLGVAQQIAGGVFELRQQRGYLPLTVAVLDAGGHVVVLQREDGASIMRPQIASGKAWGALGMGLPSRELARRAQGQPQFFAALAPGGLVPVPGGVLVRDPQTREIVGAVRVSGDTSDRDEECAVAAIEATGLVADATAES
ncbi:MAG: heme-binding protein [Streptosporangiales bacterium]|nr:heme-binding protein [Streptosporangiales bacterium]